MIKRTRPRFVLYSIRMEAERLVKVRAYKRRRYGRIEKVQSHFRRYL